MLANSEIRALQTNTFLVHCLDMRLTSRSDRFPSYQGPGSIKQDSNGILRFELYDHTKVADLNLPGTGVPGSLIPPDHYYELTTVDLTGRQWKVDRVLPSPSGRMDKPGMVCHGSIGEMQCAEEGDWSSGLYLFFPGKFEMPTNRLTEIVHSRGDEKVRYSTARDTWELELPQLKIVMTLEEESGLRVSATPEGELLSGLDSRIEETLWFILARPCRWLLKMERRNGQGSTAIRSYTWRHVNAKLQPPVDWVYNSIENQNELFGRYLKYINAYHAPRYHPTSVNVLQVLRASGQTIEAEALALGVAVESLINREYSTYGEPSSAEQVEVDQLLDLVNRSTVSARMKDRARGALDRIKQANAEGCLRQLQKGGHISEDLVDAWRRIRHATAHGHEIDKPPEEIIQLCDRAYTLFCLLIFSRVGYTGDYTNRAVPEWPSEQSRPFWTPRTS